MEFRGSKEAFPNGVGNEEGEEPDKCDGQRLACGLFDLVREYLSRWRAGIAGTLGDVLGGAELGRSSGFSWRGRVWSFDKLRMTEGEN